MAVGPFVCDGGADDAAVNFVAPQQIAGPGIQSFEPTVHGAVENEVAGRGDCAGPDGEVFLYYPDGCAADRIPGGDFAPVPTGPGLHMHVGSHVGGACDVVDLHVEPVHAHVFVGDVDQAGVRTETARVPVLGAGRCRTDVVDFLAQLGLLVGVDDQSPSFEVDALGRVDRAKRVGRQDGAVGSIDDIHIAVAIGMHENFAHFAAERHVEQDLLVHSVVVVLIVGGELVERVSRAAVGVA